MFVCTNTISSFFCFFFLLFQGRTLNGLSNNNVLTLLEQSYFCCCLYNSKFTFNLLKKPWYFNHLLIIFIWTSLMLHQNVIINLLLFYVRENVWIGIFIPLMSEKLKNNNNIKNKTKQNQEEMKTICLLFLAYLSFVVMIKCDWIDIDLYFPKVYKIWLQFLSF